MDALKTLFKNFRFICRPTVTPYSPLLFNNPFAAVSPSTYKPRRVRIQTKYAGSANKDLHGLLPPAKAFMIFQRYNYARIRAENPSTAGHQCEIQRLLRTAWRHLPPAQRSFYFDEQRKDRRRYLADKARLGIPHRPVGPYMSFHQAEYPKLMLAAHPGASTRELVSMLRSRWTAMSREEKRPYHETATAEKERYAAELKACGDDVSKVLAQNMMERSEKRWDAIAGKLGPPYANLGRRLNPRERSVIRTKFRVPRRPKGAFIQFFNEQLSRLRQQNHREPAGEKVVGQTSVGISMEENLRIQRDCVKAWKQNENDLRRRYQTDFQLRSQKYAEELKGWKAQMTADGNELFIPALLSKSVNPEGRRVRVRMKNRRYRDQLRREKLLST